MKHDRKEYWLERLCNDGRLGRDELDDDESAFLAALAEWGIEYFESKQHIALESNLQLIDMEKIQSGLTSALGDRFNYHYRLVTGSTNADALYYFEQNQQPVIALAEMQTTGRGRRGNSWVSPFAKNIYCTIGMPRSIQAGNLGLLSIITGIALCRALEACGIDGVRVKWPNDLYFRQHKLGGVLIESRPVSTDEYYVAIGFGINVMMSADDLAAISQAATSIDMIINASASREGILLGAIERVVTAIDGFDESAIPWLVGEFDNYDALRGQRICATTGEQTVHGINAGINSIGQLQLDGEQGRLTFSAAEISLRSMD